MKFELVYFQGQASKWTDQAAAEFVKKISVLTPFSEVAIRSPSRGRENLDEKRELEAKALLKYLKANDRLFLFDERGSTFRDSRQFSEYLVKNLGQSARIVFAIGGPYGFADDIRKRAAASISLSALTLNHHVARVVALEQIYRALSIWKGLPYHNE